MIHWLICILFGVAYNLNMTKIDVRNGESVMSSRSHGYVRRNRGITFAHSSTNDPERSAIKLIVVKHHQKKFSIFPFHLNVSFEHSAVI